MKWISFGVVGSLFAVSHIGMIGHLATRKTEPTLPSINPPVGPYTSYRARVTKDGYDIEYKANDPKTAFITKDIKEKGGFLGLANENTQITEEYFMDGQTNQGGSVSNHRSWLDKKTKALEDDINSSTQKSEACVKAIGSAEGTGRLVGTSIGAAAAPALSGIPFVGWVAAGWVAMFGGNQGAEMGGNMAEDLNKNC
ncbi:MAG TPA: hypothetical protein DDY16_05675 [Tenacibaculum sp.]|nr:hypothetical protein [Tenacibaculum sp.]